MKKWVVLGISAVMMTGAVASPVCAAGEAVSEDLTGKKAGIIMPNLSNELLANTADNIKSALEEKGMEVEVVASDNDSAKELQELENYASMGMDDILIMPIGASAAEVGSTLKRLSEQGTRIISFGNKVEEGSCYAQILTNFEEFGEDTAQSAAKWIDATFPDAEDGSIEVALVTTTSSQESKSQSEALRKVEEYTSKAKIVETYERGFTDPITKVQEYMDMMVTTHPDVKAVLTYSDDQAQAVNEVIMRTQSIDKEKFGVFCSGWTEDLGNKIKASVSNDSVIRATNNYVNEEGGEAYLDIVSAVEGSLPLDENGMYYYTTATINTDNVDEFLK